MADSGIGSDEVSGCSRTLLLQQTERLLVSVAGSLVPSVLKSKLSTYTQETVGDK